MSKVSKTARASMAQTVGQKAVIPDEVYIKNLRYDVNNGIHATQEGAKALLRAYDAALTTINELNVEVSNQSEVINGFKGTIANYVARVTELEAEIKAAQEIFGTAKSTEYSTLEELEAEAKNNYD